MIIYLDNDPNDVFFFSRALARHGYEGEFRHCGAFPELRKLLTAQARFDAVVLDLKLDGFNGIDALRWIKDQEHLASTPVYMLSSGRFEEEICEAFAAGAEAYLFKPQRLGDWDEIINTVVPSTAIAPRLPWRQMDRSFLNGICVDPRAKGVFPWRCRERRVQRVQAGESWR